MKLNFFVKKFEISKLIYSYYNKKNIGEGDCTNLTNYLLLSSCCMESNINKFSLRFFNAGLKLNDLLIAELNSIENFSELLLLKKCLEKELSIFNELRGKLM